MGISIWRMCAFFDDWRGQSWFCIVFYGTFEPWAPVDKVMVSFSSACATMLLCGHAFAALTPHPELRIGWLPEAIFFNELMGISIWGPRYGGSIFHVFSTSLWGLAFGAWVLFSFTQHENLYSVLFFTALLRCEQSLKMCFFANFQMFF